MAVLDIMNAYRVKPMHPDDQLLLGVTWEGQGYVETAILRSAPKIFTALTDLLEWGEGVSITWTTVWTTR